MKPDGPAPERVSTLELFFDLVFVFTITQVSAVVVGSPTGAGVVRAAILLGVIYWMYDGYAWMTNVAGPSSWPHTALLLVGMAGFFVCALAVPRAFGDDGAVFGVSYLVVTLVHLVGLILWPGRTPVDTIYAIAPGNLISAGLVLAAGWSHGSAIWLLWTGALALKIVTPLVTQRVQGFEFNAPHYSERHNTIILIVLGESLVSIGLSTKYSAVSRPLMLGALAGLAATTAMWWAYFAGEDRRSATAFCAATARRRVVQAITGYELANAVMIFGVTALAAGIRLRVNQLVSPAPWFEATLVAVGAALFLLGSAGFRLALGFGSPLPRAVGALGCLTAIPAGRALSTAAGLMAVNLVFAATLAIEHALERRKPAV